MTFHDIEFAAVMEVARKGCDRLPALMRRIIVAVDCSVNSSALPVKTVSISQFQREPDIDKAAIDEEYSQFIGIRNDCLSHDLRKFYLSNLP